MSPVGVASEPDLSGSWVEAFDEVVCLGPASAAESYLEEPLRMLVHLIMSQPEYQLG